MTQHEIDLMNRIKKVGEDVGALVKDLEAVRLLDQRFIAIGKTQIQLGFMALGRGVAQPTTF